MRTQPAQGAAEVLPQTRTPFARDPGLAVSRGEHDVVMQAGVGVGHGAEGWHCIAVLFYACKIRAGAAALNSSLLVILVREKREERRALGTLVLASLRDAWALARTTCALTRGVASLNPSLQAEMAPPSGREQWPLAGAIASSSLQH